MTRWIAIALLAAGCVAAPRLAPVAAESRIEVPAPVEKAKEPVAPKPRPIAPPVAQVTAPAPPEVPAQAPVPPAAKAPAPVVAPPLAAPKPPPVAAAPSRAPKAIPPPAPPKAPPPTTAAKAPAAQPLVAPLDLKTLEERLKETDAIGVMTKLSLKNQVDDLVDEFRAYYAGRSKASLGELRRPYDLLLMKVLTLLQDRDPPLARAVNASRDQIWSILSDREKFFSTLS